MKNIDIEVLDELIEMCEGAIGSRFKKAKPAAQQPARKENDDVDVGELAALYEE